MAKRLKNSRNDSYIVSKKGTTHYRTETSYHYKKGRVYKNRTRYRNGKFVDSSVTSEIYENDKRITWAFVQGVFMAVIMILFGSLFFTGYFDAKYTKNITEKTFKHTYYDILDDYKVDIMSLKNASDLGGKSFYYKGGDFKYVRKEFALMWDVKDVVGEYAINSYQHNIDYSDLAGGLFIYTYASDNDGNTGQFLLVSTSEFSKGSFEFCLPSSDGQKCRLQSRDDYIYFYESNADKLRFTSETGFYNFKEIMSLNFDCYDRLLQKTEYEYHISYNDYDWTYKLNQLSKLKNIFNIGIFKTNGDTLENALVTAQEYAYYGYIRYDYILGYLEVDYDNCRIDGKCNEVEKFFNTDVGEYIKTAYYSNNAITHERTLIQKNPDLTYEIFQDNKMNNIMNIIGNFLVFPISVFVNLVYDLGVLVSFMVSW